MISKIKVKFRCIYSSNMFAEIGYVYLFHSFVWLLAVTYTNQEICNIS